MISTIVDLESNLKQQFPDLQLFFLEEVSSTNSFLKHIAPSIDNIAFCYANTQTSGYGQQGRSWCSDQSSLTFSILLDFKVPLDGLDGLTQLIVLNVIESLSDYSSQPFKIKWPNDLYVGNQKAGGILVESVSYSKDSSRLVIGIGLNNGLAVSLEDTYTQKMVSPGSVVLNDVDRFSFLFSIVTRLITLAQCFSIGMFRQFVVNYGLVDYFDNDETVNVYDNATIETGTYKGLNPNGELLVEINGKLVTYRSGSVSIRPSNEKV